MTTAVTAATSSTAIPTLQEEIKDLLKGFSALEMINLPESCKPRAEALRQRVIDELSLEVVSGRQAESKKVVNVGNKLLKQIPPKFELTRKSMNIEIADADKQNKMLSSLHEVLAQSKTLPLGSLLASIASFEDLTPVIEETKISKRIVELSDNWEKFGKELLLEIKEKAISQESIESEINSRKPSESIVDECHKLLNENKMYAKEPFEVKYEETKAGVADIDKQIEMHKHSRLGEGLMLMQGKRLLLRLLKTCESIIKVRDNPSESTMEDINNVISFLKAKPEAEAEENDDAPNPEQCVIQ